MVFSARITNLGKYNEGVILDTLLAFPTTTEQVQAALRQIKVDGLFYEELFITEYRTSLPIRLSSLGEYESIDELNYLASRIEAVDSDQVPRFMAAIQHGEYGDCIKDIINLTYNLDCYELIPDVMSEEDYGRHLVDCEADFSLDEKAKLYFDYQSYGEDSAINDGGAFTKYGYIRNNGSRFTEVYDGEHIPEEYKVFRYPLQPTKKISTSKRMKGVETIR